MAFLLLLPLASLPLAAAEATGWYMFYDSATDSTSLRREVPNGAIPLSIPDGGRRVFAEATAAAETIDPAGTWPYSIRLEKAQPHAETFMVSVGKVGASSTLFTPFASVTLVADKTTFSGSLTIPAGHNLAPGERLALEVDNLPSTAKVGAASKAIQVMTNDPSNPSMSAPLALADYPYAPNTPPTIAPADDAYAEATSAAGAVVTYDPPATSDAREGAGVATCAPASGSTFPLGTTTVTCDAQDAKGAWATPVTFRVFVYDTTAPVIGQPMDLYVAATDEDSAIVHYASPATSDAVDGAGVASCSPPSGSDFPVGTTTVTCTAADAAGNAAEPRTFLVSVSSTGEPPLPTPELPPLVLAGAGLVALALVARRR